jgi:pSer/pThr/pTyr-binding forkhead associated (FHA) protein
MIVGRVPSADLYLDDEQVSRLHAQITRTGGTFAVADLGSTNGTLVNGQRVSRAFLRDGDRIQIGQTVLTFRQGADR